MSRGTMGVIIYEKSRNHLKEIFSLYTGKKEDLVPILLKTQDKFGYLPDETMIEISKFINLPATKVYGVASFYDRFRFKPLGRKIISVCKCPSCYVKGASFILSKIENQLGIKEGETTSDNEFSLVTASSIGCSGSPPCLTINGKIYANMSPSKVMKLLKEKIDKQEVGKVINRIKKKGIF